MRSLQEGFPYEFLFASIYKTVFLMYNVIANPVGDFVVYGIAGQFKGKGKCLMGKFRIVALVLGVLASFAVFGCSGGDKKPVEKPATKTEAPVEKKEEDKKPVAKVKPVPKSPLYKYALHLDDEKKLPPMTDEVIKNFEEQAKKIKVAPEDMKKGRHGIWVFNSSPVSAGAQVYTYRWTAELDGHHDSEFTNDKGKKINEQHYAHIDMTVMAKDNKLKKVRLFKYHVTKDIGEKGKTEEIFEKTFE